MQWKRTLTAKLGVLSIIVGYAVQWLSNHLAYSTVANMEQNPGALIQVRAHAASFGFFTSLGTQLAYFGFLLIAIAVYTWIVDPGLKEEIRQPTAD